MKKSSGRFRIRTLGLPMAAMVAATSVVGCKPAAERASGQQAAAPVAVKWTQPQRGEITRSILLPATVVPDQQATLYSKVAGYLKTITVEKGDEVKEGAELADIEVPELLADRVKFQAEADVAAIEYKRFSESAAKAPDLVVPQAVDAAKGKLAVAKANLARVDTLLSFAKITAPFSGVVTKRMVDPGAFIPAATSGSAAQNAAILTLMDFRKVRVQVAVPEQEAPLIARGQPVNLNVEALPGRSFEGTVTRLAYALDDATKTMLVEVELPNPKRELRPGMFAMARIGLERHEDALLLPVEALVMEKANVFVFTVADGKATKVSVKTSFNDGAKFEVLSGVTANDRVVLVGRQTLANGQAVTIAEGK